MINKKGLSEVVSTVLILVLVVVTVGIVWAVINNFVKSNLNETGSCFETFGKVSINDRYTCYNSSTKELRFAIDIADIDISEVLVGITSVGTSTTFKINSAGSVIPYTVMYPSRSTNVTLPKENAGLTYLFNMSAAGYGAPDEIRIAPLIGNNQCDVSDELEQIDDCLSVLN